MCVCARVCVCLKHKTISTYLENKLLFNLACAPFASFPPADTKRKRRRTRTEKESVAATEITAATIERNTLTARRRRAKTKIGRGNQTETKATSRWVSCVTAGQPSVASPATLDCAVANAATWCDCACHEPVSL